jgi:hypothetical protein
VRTCFTTIFCLTKMPVMGGECSAKILLSSHSCLPARILLLNPHSVRAAPADDLECLDALEDGSIRQELLNLRQNDDLQHAIAQTAAWHGCAAAIPLLKAVGCDWGWIFPYPFYTDAEP